MPIFSGIYFDGRNSAGTIATVEANGRNIVLQRPDSEALHFSLEQVRISDRVGRIPRAFTFPGYGRFETLDNEAVDAFCRSQGRLGLAARMEASWRLAGISAVGLLVFLAFTYLVILPATADWVAQLIPEKWVVVLSSGTRDWLDRKEFISEAQLSLDEQLKARRVYESAEKAFPQYALKFRTIHGGRIGPNAFALPDGAIYVTDSLIKLLTEEEVFGVILHEIGHVEYRHGLSLVIESSLISAVLFTIAGGDWTSIPLVLLNSAYSRKYESAADAFAKKNLKRLGISSKVLAAALDKMAKDRGEEGVLFNFLSTHPLTQERRAELLKDN